MNWLIYVMRILPIIPGLVAHIEQIHGDAKSGAEKKQLAMESLGLATQTATQLIPEQQTAIDAATTLASSAIDNTVAVMNAMQPAVAPAVKKVSNVAQ